MRQIIRVHVTATLRAFNNSALADALEFLAQWERDNPDPVPLPVRRANNDPYYQDFDLSNPEDPRMIKSFGTWRRAGNTGIWRIWR